MTKQQILAERNLMIAIEATAQAASTVATLGKPDLADSVNRCTIMLRSVYERVYKETP